MKIGLLGMDDPGDVLSYSGTPYHLAHYLRKAGHEVRYLGPYPLKYGLLIRLYSRITKVFTGKHLLWRRHPVIVRQYARIVNKFARANRDLDILLATSAFYLAGAEPKIPLAFWGDTTVAGVIGQYALYTDLAASTLKQAHKVEQSALDSVDLAIFSNQWAVDIAIASYDVEPAKVHMITYGANLLHTPTEAEIGEFLASRPPGALHVLLLGTDWKRKGVDIAIEVVSELRKRGYDATLTVAGCHAPADYVPLEYVTVLGMIAKSDPAGLKQLTDLLQKSHVFLLPTRAECAAVVLAEASAFGLPVATSDVGGNASLIAEGQNGAVIPIDAPIGEWADAVESFVRDRPGYEALVWNIHRYFAAELSWEVSVARFETLVTKALLSKA